MPRVFVYLICASLAAATATGCGGSGNPSRRSTQSPSASPTPTLALDRGAVSFSKADTQRLRRIYAADLRYLARKGLTGASRIELRLLSGSDTFYCSPVEITYTARGPGPDYCQPTSGAPIGTVVLNARFLSDDVPSLVTADGPRVSARQMHSIELGAAAVVLGHELGHAEQALRRGQQAPLEGVAIELQADCYAGQIVAKVEPRLLGAAMQFVRQLPGDSRHGSAGQRLAAFKRGARGGNCTTSYG